MGMPSRSHLSLGVIWWPTSLPSLNDRLWRIFKVGKLKDRLPRKASVNGDIGVDGEALCVAGEPCSRVIFATQKPRMGRTSPWSISSDSSSVDKPYDEQSCEENNSTAASIRNRVTTSEAVMLGASWRLSQPQKRPSAAEAIWMYSLRWCQLHNAGLG